MIQILKNFILILFAYFFTFNPVYSENITGANPITSDNTTQKKFNADGTSLTITNSATLSLGAQQTVHINSKDNGIVTIEDYSKDVDLKEYLSWGEENNGVKIQFSEGYKRIS